MEDYHQLCRQVAEGAASQKRRAWRTLLLDGALWQAAAQAVADPAELERLCQCYDLLAGNWNRTPIEEFHGRDFQMVNEMAAAACRLLAAAVVALVARHHPAHLAALSEWSLRALDPPGVSPLPPPLPALTGTAGERAEQALRIVAQQCPEGPPRLATARDTVLSLLAPEPAVPTGAASGPRLRVPVLLTSAGEGFVVWLWLEQVPNGTGVVFQAPNTLFDPVQQSVRQAMDEVAAYLRRQVFPDLAVDIRWWLTNLPQSRSGDPIPVEGASFQAAAAAALCLLLRGRSYRPGCAITATLGPDGTLGRVEGLNGSAPKLVAALSLRQGQEPVLVVMSPENRPSPTQQLEWEARGVRLVVAQNLAEALHWVSADADLPAAAAPGPGPERAVTGNRVVLLYQRDAQPDEGLAGRLEAELRGRGFQVFLERSSSHGAQWVRQMAEQIRNADAVVLLLSAAAARSEWLTHEVQVAVETSQAKDGRPRLLAVRIGDCGLLPDPLRLLLAHPATPTWNRAEDTAAVVGALERWLREPPETASSARIEDLVPPTGVLDLGSSFYLVRPTDHDFRAALARRDSIVRVRGARQMGKTSLLARGLQEARRAGARVILTDLQVFNARQLDSVDGFLLALARWIARQLELDVSPDDLWDPLQGPNWNFREFLLSEILERSSVPVVWALDEVDRLFTCGFSSEVFALFRSWHNERALNPGLPWSRLTLAISYASEAQLFVADLNQSPFNVGTRITLRDFTPEQTDELNRLYGQPLHTTVEREGYQRLVGGQPFLTHLGLHEMVTRNLSLASLETQIDRDDGIFGDHLRRLLTLLTGDPELEEAMREVLNHRPCPSQQVYYRLWSGGVITGDTPRTARPRCGLYETYLRRCL